MQKDQTEVPKRPRGRPRKVPEPLPSRGETGTRPNRAAANTAREKLKMMSANRVEQVSNARKVRRKWATVPLNDDEEEVQTYTIRTPFLNFWFLDDNDWLPLNLEDWARAPSLEELGQIDGAVLDPVDDPEQIQRRAMILLEDPPQLPDYEQFSDEDEEDDLQPVQGNAARGPSYGQQLQQLARNPTSAAQVNNSRVVNLNNVPVENEAPQRPVRERRIPSRLQDYDLS